MYRVTIKVGSNVLTREDGKLDITNMSSLVDQIAVLHARGIEVILISSGAVASGRTILHQFNKIDTISERQLFSAIGQVKLINRYADFFDTHDIVCAQVLATKNDFSTRLHYLNQRNCLEVLLSNRVIPIVNENDTVSITELMFTDNDELSGLLATMMGCQQLIILSNIDGIYDGNPSDKNTRLITSIDPSTDNPEVFFQTSKSSKGRGGIQTKYNIAKKLSEEGIEVIIANGKRPNILIDILDGNNVPHTAIKSVDKTISSVKKWLAHSDDFCKGEIHVNAGLEEKLMTTDAISILPIGIEKIVGFFEIDDVVKIINTKGVELGVGKVSMDSEASVRVLGKSQQKPIIHYDYLYIYKN